jgi:hypothetical protein
MGASVSTLGGWSVILAIAGWYAYRYYTQGRKRELARLAATRQKAEDRQGLQTRKESKPKKPRLEAHTKDLEGSDKAVQIKQRPVKNTTGQSVPGGYSTDDGMDNKEFARSMAGVKQGTSFTGQKKSDEKKQRSVKQSKAQEPTRRVTEEKMSAPSSTTGADADDDQSPAESPEIHPADSKDISDMLEKPASGPSVLRITAPEKPQQQKEKKVKAPEQGESKKQRQNKKKAEEAKMAREEAEKERKVKMEAQRRTARIAEGRAAKDGSAFVASQAPATSAWAANGTNGTNGAASKGISDGGFIPVQPLDTFEPAKTNNGTSAAPKKPSQPANKTSDWKADVPSEEEQMKLLQQDQEWSTVNKKKPGKGKRKDGAGSPEESDNNQVTNPQQVVPVTSEPVVTKSQHKSAKPNGRPAIGQQSSFAALSGPEQEEEWDV